MPPFPQCALQLPTPVGDGRWATHLCTKQLTVSLLFASERCGFECTTRRKSDRSLRWCISTAAGGRFSISIGTIGSGEFAASTRWAVVGSTIPMFRDTFPALWRPPSTQSRRSSQWPPIGGLSARPLALSGDSWPRPAFARAWDALITRLPEKKACHTTRAEAERADRIRHIEHVGRVELTDLARRHAQVLERDVHEMMTFNVLGLKGTIDRCRLDQPSQ
jgi:hypothetical protein